MNTNEHLLNSITRRNFMKKTALTAGAVTLLGQGVSLASGSLSFIISESKTRNTDYTTTVQSPGPVGNMDFGAILAAITAAGNKLYDIIPGNSQKVEGTDRSAYVSDPMMIMSGTNNSATFLGNGEWEVFLGGPIKVTKQYLKLRI
jgi:hypothetical protein